MKIRAQNNGMSGYAPSSRFTRTMCGHHVFWVAHMCAHMCGRDGIERPSTSSDVFEALHNLLFIDGAFTVGSDPLIPTLHASCLGCDIWAGSRPHRSTRILLHTRIAQGFCDESIVRVLGVKLWQGEGRRFGDCHAASSVAPFSSDGDSNQFYACL